MHEQVHGIKPLPDAVVLELKLDDKLPEYVAPNAILEALGPTHHSLQQIIALIDRANHDPHVKGLVADIATNDIGLAQTQELRAAITRFRAAGRFAYAFSESFGEGGSVPAANPITLPPPSIKSGCSRWVKLGWPGVSAQVPFLHDLLDKIGIEVQFGQRKEYKSAAESLTRTSMSAPAREETNDLLDQLYGQITDGIAEGPPDGRRQG